MADLECHLIFVGNQEQSPAKPSHPFSLSDDRPRRLYVRFIVSLYLFYMVLIQLVRLRYKEEKEGPFETHLVLMRTTVLAFLVAGIISVVLHNQYLPSTSKGMSTVVLKIAKIVFSISVIIAYVTLLMVLFLG